jgi:hypothetical protein
MITCHLISAGYKEDEILLWLYENIMTWLMVSRTRNYSVMKPCMTHWFSLVQRWMEYMKSNVANAEMKFCKTIELILCKWNKISKHFLSTWIVIVTVNHSNIMPWNFWSDPPSQWRSGYGHDRASAQNRP